MGAPALRVTMVSAMAAKATAVGAIEARAMTAR